MPDHAAPRAPPLASLVSLVETTYLKSEPVNLSQRR